MTARALLGALALMLAVVAGHDGMAAVAAVVVGAAVLAVVAVAGRVAETGWGCVPDRRVVAGRG